ncbi:hypothetical protein M426DRAFT_45230, partial [Hypoxylon sp. CI-4A]
YQEEIQTTKQWIKDSLPRDRFFPRVASYLLSLVPFLGWIRRYNLRWIKADIVLGFTLSLIVIPQGLSYPMLAGLSPQYGLYTSLAGSALYFLFGTAKDVSVGATAVISLLSGKTTHNVLDKHMNFSAEEVARTHALLAGFIFLFLGLFKLGWIIELIPHVGSSAFVTAAAINIALGQIPMLLGIRGVNTKVSTFTGFVDTCKALNRTKLYDALIGITTLALLTSIKILCDRMTRKLAREEGKKWQKLFWQWFSPIRFFLCVFIYTLIGERVNRDLPVNEPKFRITGEIPAGINVHGLPSLRGDMVMAILPELPATVIVIIIEHISIARSFGRRNGYSISPSQELVSLSATNIIGPFIGAYASTASFGGSAILDKTRTKTPLAGLVNAAMIILTLYEIRKVLKWFPSASMAALIIHAVINLVESPTFLYKTWLMSPPDLIIFVVGVLMSFFNSLEIGIYVSTGLSAAMLLIRLARAPGRFLGRVRIYPYLGPGQSDSAVNSSYEPQMRDSRDVFLPLDRKDGSNPSISIEAPLPGVFVYRFPEGLNYINQSQHMDLLSEYIKSETRRTTEAHHGGSADRLWNEPVDTNAEEPSDQPAKPALKAVIFDFSTVDGTDTGAIDGLVELRKELDRWADPEPVGWHFAGVNSRWVRRALAAAGFGYPSPRELESQGRLWRPVFNLAE